MGRRIPYLKTFTLCTALTWLNSDVIADATLSVKPLKCVSLHKGQTCYQNLNFTWNSKGKKLCLYKAKETEPLHCHALASVKSFRYEFASDKSQTFELRDESGNRVATVNVEVASVYKGKRRATTGWRIF